MKYVSYWRDTTVPFAGGHTGPVEGQFDVAVIGGGFTGLGAALQLAKGGAKVIVLEAEQVGAGASGRNGGHLNNGLAHSYIAAKTELGPERAIALYKAFDASIDTLENLRNVRDLLAPYGRVRVALLSSRYHLARCAFLAQQLGFEFELVAAEDRFVPSLARMRRLVLEAGYILCADVGMRWARLIGHQRMLEWVT